MGSNDVCEHGVFRSVCGQCESTHDDGGVCVNCGRSPEPHEDDITGNAPWCLDCMDAEDEEGEQA